MAAASEAYGTHLVELRHLRSPDFTRLFDEETAEWKAMLDWDYQASAGLVRRFMDMQALTGHALFINGRVAGYCYFVVEDHKALIGDLYVLREFATVENEGLLLGKALDVMLKTTAVHRIEAQLMMMRNASRMPLPYWRYLKVHTRDFMELPLDGIGRLPVGRALKQVMIDNWTERKQEEAALLIATAYQGHIDSEINDQYRSPVGARRFLNNIVQYPGCGSFFQPGSFVALEGPTGRLSGLCLSSLVSQGSGHITQVCVSKAARSKGVGYELLRRSLASLAKHQCHKATLTVTSANREAIDVYRKMGFRRTRDFAAYVWEGF